MNHTIKNKKILFFTNQMDTPFNKISGVYNLARLLYLKKLGYNIIIVCPINLLPPPKLYKPNLFFRYMKEQFSIPFDSNINSFRIFYPKYFCLPKKVNWFSELFFLHIFCGKSIKKIINSFQPDIIISSWLHPFATYSRYIKKYHDIPYYSYCEGSDILIFPEKYSGWSKIQSIINEYVDSIILISLEMEKKVNENRNLLRTKTIIDGYRDDLFFFKSPPKVSGKINFLSVGALLKVKGHDILIEAVSKLNFENNLMIIGDGEEYKNLIALVKKFNIYNRFKSVLHVNQNELNNYINNCNIFCMPSRSDALPAAALEAMACGRPVVACGVGGLKDIIIDGFNGFLTKPDNPTSFANGLKRAREHIWDYKKISYWTKNNYGWEKSINELHEYMINNE